MNNIFTLIVGGILIGLAFFFGYKFYKENDTHLDKNSNIKVLNNNVDLGIYKITKPKYVFFKIVNNNDFDLKLTKILPDCDCYSVTSNKEVIMPKDTLVVKAKFDATPGPFLKKVYLYFGNDKDPLVMFFKGKILSDDADKILINTK